MKLTKSGQVQDGDMIVCEYKGKPVQYTAEEVLDSGTDHEEVIIDLENNRYFITSMVIAGDSWAKNVNIFKNLKGV